jgi:hypothetical protein
MPGGTGVPPEAVGVGVGFPVVMPSAWAWAYAVGRRSPGAAAGQGLLERVNMCPA